MIFFVTPRTVFLQFYPPRTVFPARTKSGYFHQPDKKRVFSLPLVQKTRDFSPHQKYFSCDRGPGQFCSNCTPLEQFFMPILPPLDSFFHPFYPPGQFILTVLLRPPDNFFSFFTPQVKNKDFPYPPGKGDLTPPPQQKSNFQFFLMEYP